MKTSQYGLDQIVKREGVILHAYKDSVGVWTIGIGHTSAAGAPAVKAGMTLTRQQAYDLLAKDLVQYEDAVNKAVKVPLAQNEFDALVSFAYNVGSAGMARSTVVRRLNAGDRKGAAAAFMFWTKPPEITGRRRTEMVQFLTPYPTKTETAVVVATASTAIAAGVAGAASQPHNWHWYLLGTVAALSLGSLGFIAYFYRKANNNA